MYVCRIHLTLSTASRHRDEIRYVLLTNVCWNIIWNDIQQSGYIRVYPTIQHQCHEWQWKMKLLTGDERKGENWALEGKCVNFRLLLSHEIQEYNMYKAYSLIQKHIDYIFNQQALWLTMTIILLTKLASEQRLRK